LLCVGATTAISDRSAGVFSLVDAVMVESVPEGEEDRR